MEIANGTASGKIDRLVEISTSSKWQLSVV
jgi:hypothetical protein